MRITEDDRPEHSGEKQARRLGDVANGGRQSVDFLPSTDQDPTDTSDRSADGYVIVDIETTGLSANQHRVLELAVVRTDGSGGVVHEWVQRFNPDGPVGATHIHGITDADA